MVEREAVVAGVRVFLAENLREDDFTVLTAASGGEAMDALAVSRPDVVLLDVVLPDMSGYDVCRRVRQADSVNDPWDPDLPIIMLSAKAEHTDRVRGLNRGADDYVTRHVRASGASRSPVRALVRARLLSGVRSAGREHCHCRAGLA